MSAPWMDLTNHCAGLWASGIARASWQGSAALGMAWAACRVLPGLPPRLRCWLWRLAYLKLLLALFWATPVDLPVLTSQPSGVSRQASVVRHPSSGARHPVSGVALQASDRPGQNGSEPAAFVGTSNNDFRPTTGMVLLWLLGVAWCAARVPRDWRAARRLCRRCRPVREELLAGECQALCRQLGLRPAPRLLFADGPGSPMLLDALQPVLVLPAALVTQCAPAELKLMLAHELAHLRRHDLRWGWLAVVTHTLFYFHPLVWLANREWRLSQELAADEMAVLATGTPVAEYGEMLVKVASQLRHHPPLGLTTVGVLESPRTLHQRLRAMAQIRRLSRQTLLFSGGLLAAAALALLVPWRLTARAAPAGQQDSRGAHLRPSSVQQRAAGQSRTARAPAVTPSSSPPMYFHTAMFVNNIGQIALRSDLLNVPIDLDLRQVPLREALRQLCAPTHQGYTIDANVPADQRVTVQGKRMQLFRALDEVIRQVGGGWMQEMRGGKPVIRIGRGLFLTTHTGPLKLPRDGGFLKQLGAIAHLTARADGAASR